MHHFETCTTINGYITGLPQPNYVSCCACSTVYGLHHEQMQRLTSQLLLRTWRTWDITSPHPPAFPVVLSSSATEFRKPRAFFSGRTSWPWSNQKSLFHDQIPTKRGGISRMFWSGRKTLWAALHKKQMTCQKRRNVDRYDLVIHLS